MKSLKSLIIEEDCRNLTNIDPIKKLTNLENLSVSSQPYEIPKEIEELKNLKSLVLNCHCLHKNLEIDFSQLQKLESLTLRFNELENLPKGIEELKNLKSLVLQGHCLPKIVEIDFSQLQKLESLTLRFNELENVPEGIWELSAIKHLHISVDNIKNYTPLEKILNLKNLQDLEFDALTIEERLKLFFMFSGQIQKGLFNLQKHGFPFFVLLKNAEFYFPEKKELAIKLSLLMLNIDKLKASKVDKEQILDRISQEINYLTIDLFGIGEEQVTLWMEKYLNSKKLDYHMRLKRIAWFSDFLASSSFTFHPLLDQTSYCTLQEIFTLTDSSLQEDAKERLVSLYKPGNEDLLNAWQKDLSRLRNWQILPHLLLITARVNDSLRESIMRGLSTRYYQNSAKIKPVLEILYLLITQKNLNQEDIESILKLILVPPSSKAKEKKQDFLAQQKAFRAKQLPYLNVIKSIIDMKKSAYLQKLTEENLILRLQEACKQTFEIKKENALALVDTLQFERYPNALIIYASRICNLPKDKKNEFMQRLGKFIDDVLEEKFPESRYCTSAEDPNNLHLNTIFKTQDGKIDQKLLEKWKSSFVIGINSNEPLNTESSTPPHQLVKNRILQALRDKHLGAKFQKQYPRLYMVQEGKDIKIIKSIIKHATNKLSTQNMTEEERKSLNIEIKCLELLALDEQSSYSSIIQIIKDLKTETSETQFKQDLEDIIALLQPKNLPTKFVSIEDTNSWQDWLLMGTEVKSSCQSIEGDPNFSKALLSYITDGKYKLIIVRDADGKIAARCLLRILWDNNKKKPVLFKERLYMRYNDKSLAGYILTGCIKKAETMGLCLVESANSSRDSTYTGSLISLSSPAPYEYVDATRLGLVEHGKYALRYSRLIYEPETK